jgi:hypothetical protein
MGYPGAHEVEDDDGVVVWEGLAVELGERAHKGVVDMEDEAGGRIPIPIAAHVELESV